MTRTHPDPRRRPAEGCGRWPAKAVVGETFAVSATVFREGHDAVNANVVLRDPEGAQGPLDADAPGAPGTDRWSAEVTPTAEGDWTFAVEAWSDPVATWHHDAEIKIEAGMDVELDARGGRPAARARRRGASRPAPAAGAARRRRPRCATRRARCRPGSPRPTTPRSCSDPGRAPAARLRHRDRALAAAGSTASARSTAPGTSSSRGPRAPRSTRRDGVLRVRHVPDRRRAAARRRRDGLRRRLPAADPPDRRRQPQGPQQHPDPRPRRRRLAVGDRLREGGHDAIHPDLGTIEDFDAFVARAARARAGGRPRLRAAGVARPPVGARSTRSGSPSRADGTIAYAENPPKKYQDIYPINFDNDPEGIYAEMLRGPAATGWTTACGSSASTTRTPSRCASGSG